MITLNFNCTVQVIWAGFIISVSLLKTDLMLILALWSFLKVFNDNTE